MANLKVGSSGKDVEKLQQALIKAGYNVGNTGADGVYGSKTAAAVKQYQKDHGLSVDGIAGNNTMGSLYSTPQMTNALGTLAKGSVLGAQTVAGNNNAKSVNTANQGLKTMAGGAVAGAQIAAGAPVTANNVQSEKGKDPIKEVNLDETETGAPKTEIKESAEEEPVAGTPRTEAPSFAYNPYEKSETILQAEETLRQLEASSPTYSSQWQSQINQYLNQIMNRDPFSYNFNDDALYQQYKDIYTQMGLMSMMDTMGQAAAMTGGYGNSYAQTVGQQAYNQQLSELNNIIPELYQMAYDRYTAEGDQLYKQYGMLMDQENLDYNRYLDSYNQWASKLDYTAGQVNSMAADEYQKYLDGYNQEWDKYGIEMDEYLRGVGNQETAAGLMAGVGDYGRVAEIYGLSEDEVAKLEEGYAAGTTTSGTSTSSNGNNTTTGSYDNAGLSQFQVEILQEELGITIDGKWGKDSFRAAGNMTADKAWKAYQNGTLKQNDKDEDTSSFTGTTYNEAVAYMESMGVPSTNASTIMTASEWTRRKNAGSSNAAVANYSSYEEYLAAYVEYAIETYG